jgi:hypothetical protein
MEAPMQRVSLIVIGLVVAVVGLVFTLQGLDLLGGSAMSGQHKWAVIGIVLIAVGLGSAGWAARSRRSGG